MKTIKIKICDHDPKNPFSYGVFILPRLEKYYRVELSQDPDYIFFNESTTEYLDYPDAIRIFYTGENIHPNFNLCDYAFSFDYLTMGDRHFRLPLYLSNIFYSNQDIENAGDLEFENVPKMTLAELNQKTDFCSFVYSNYLADPRRKDLFDTLSSYKHVNSGGKYLNNVGGPVANKLLFERRHKFSIAFENSSREGYTTEKLPASLAARTIPIYFGNPLVGLEFNTERFINVHSFSSLSELVNRVREIDENDDEYLRIVNSPILTDGYHFKDVLSDFEEFLKNIFDQPLQQARRISINKMRSIELEAKERLYTRVQKRKSYLRNVLVFVYTPFKKFKLLEVLKENVLQKKLGK